MLCQKCGKNPATTHIKTVINGKVTEQNLCSNCASSNGYSGFKSGSISNLLASMLVQSLTTHPQSMGMRCSCCGSAFSDIAETGKGKFGVEAAAQKYFGRSAAKLNTHQAVCIACVLPNPLVRSPKTVPQKNKSKYNTTFKRTEQTPYPFVD